LTFFVRPLLALGICGLASLGALVPGAAQAQQIFRSVGSDGRVTFSDTPPGAAASAVVPVVTAPAGHGGSAALPLALRQAATRYPVTLYSGPDCPPCAAGRTMLSARGIPFSEKTVTTAEDIEALKRLAAIPTLPLLMIGGQQLNGYSQVEWVQFLDAAGYPQTSQLPAGYQHQPPSPLVAVHAPQPPAAPKAPERGVTADERSVPSPAAPPNPSGIQF
jgi:glutaredoxin